MKAKDWPRVALTAFLMVLFGFVTVRHYNDAVEQTLLSLVMLAAGYWLGSSFGSNRKTDMLMQGVSSDDREGE